MIEYFSRVEGQWSSQGGASFGFSFGLVVLAALIYLLDIGIVYIATRDPDRNKKVSLNPALVGGGRSCDVGAEVVGGLVSH